MDDLVVQHFAFQTDLGHAIGMQITAHFLLSTFGKDHNARDLDTAARAACAGADHHQQH